MEKLNLSWEGKEYTIKLWNDTNTFYVRAFHNDQPVNPFTYQVSFEKSFDFFKQHGYPGRDVLIEQATADIHEGRIYGMNL